MSVQQPTKKKRAKLKAKIQKARAVRSRVQDNKPTRTSPPPALQDHLSYESINLRINEIRCVTTTKEISQDNIVAAAVKAQSALESKGGKMKLAARAEAGDSHDLGKFKKGERKKYPKTRVVARFSPGMAKQEWPRYYVAALLLIEQDEGAIGAVVNSAVKSVEKQVAGAIRTAASAAATTTLSAVAAGAAAGSAIPIVGTALGAAAGVAVKLAFSEIKKARADDVFDPEHVELRLEKFPAEPGEIEGTRKTATFRGFKGVYKVTYSWAAR